MSRGCKDIVAGNGCVRISFRGDRYEMSLLRFCGKVRSSIPRPTDEDSRIRRRRECLNCAKRFTTYEAVENLPVVVVKKDRSRELFDRNKLFNGMLRACEKRPVPIETLERAVDDIEMQLQNSLEREVPAAVIGEYAMEQAQGN